MREQLNQGDEGRVFKMKASQRRCICEWLTSARDPLSLATVIAGFPVAHKAAHDEVADNAIVSELESLHLAGDVVDSNDDIE